MITNLFVGEVVGRQDCVFINFSKLPRDTLQNGPSETRVVVQFLQIYNFFTKEKSMGGIFS